MVTLGAASCTKDPTPVSAPVVGGPAMTDGGTAISTPAPRVAEPALEAAARSSHGRGLDASADPTQVDPTSPPVCKTGQLVALPTSRDAGAELVLDRDPFEKGHLVIEWAGDLNEDGAVDFLARFPETCSGWGDCPVAVLVGCGGNLFASVFPTDTYVVRIEAGIVRSTAFGERWRDIVGLVRTGVSASEPPQTCVWRFDGTRYVRAEKKSAPKL